MILKQDIKTVNDYIQWKHENSCYGKTGLQIRKTNNDKDEHYYNNKNIDIIDNTILVVKYTGKSFEIIDVIPPKEKDSFDEELKLCQELYSEMFSWFGNEQIGKKHLIKSDNKE